MYQLVVQKKMPPPLFQHCAWKLGDFTEPGRSVMVCHALGDIFPEKHNSFFLSLFKFGAVQANLCTKHIYEGPTELLYIGDIASIRIHPSITSL